MKLSTKGRYATRIMIRLALAYGRGPARKKEIAETEDISADYVEQILMRLKTAGLVRSHRGVNGGFSLSCNPATMSVADVLKATEDLAVLAPCQTGDCARAGACVTRVVWDRARDAVYQVFSAASIADLAKEMRELTSAKGPNFEI